MKEVIITAHDAGQRFDKYLLKYFNAAPKSTIYKLLRKKRIKLNGKKAEGGEMLANGDKIGYYLSPETMDGWMTERKRPAYTKAPDIVYEDENILIVNKPAGLLSHPEKPGDTDTLIARVLYALHERNAYETAKTSTFVPALCNRLDRNTSGLVLCGKTPAAVREMNKRIANRRIDKYYWALVKGVVKKPGTLTGTIRKDRDSNTVTVFGNPESDTKEAILSYEPFGCGKDITILRVKLVTGRTHQIRAQLAAAGHPVLGDPKYGNREWNMRLKNEFGMSGQLLHSGTLVFHKEPHSDIDPREDGLAYLDGREFHAEPPELFVLVRDSYLK